MRTEMSIDTSALGAVFSRHPVVCAYLFGSQATGETSPKEIYGGKGITSGKEVIAYCRIGERSAHTWFVLKELLGYPDVKNYDGSWTEWGSSIRVPIEK